MAELKPGKGFPFIIGDESVCASSGEGVIKTGTYLVGNYSRIILYFVSKVSIHSSTVVVPPYKYLLMFKNIYRALAPAN